MDNRAFDSHEGTLVLNINQTRRSSLARPTLATIPSGVGMDNQAFEMSEEHTVAGTYRRMSSILRSRAANLGRRMTREAIPHLDNYANMFASRTTMPRPTMEELHESSPEENIGANAEKGEEPAVRQKFGWIEGVLIRNMLNIWGVMLFLRISWVVAMSGIWQTLIIIAISTFITLVTALSTSAITTNGEIGGGGTYYVMSRILGPEWGGSIGLLFALANAINGALNVVGFVQTVQDAMKNYGGYIIVDGGLNDTRILGVILMILVWALCGAGAKYEMITQQGLLVVLIVALVNFVVGSIMGPQTEQAQARGFLGYEGELFRETWDSAYVFNGGMMQTFFSVFAVYFPAGIGILAGANVSGDLQDPSSAIPKGTILAIIITSISYAIVAIICAGTTKREATGSVADLRNGTYLNCTIHNCTYGSYNDYQLMTLISAYGPLNYAGCFASTLSTALASYISCPKLMQVIGDDKLFPYWMVGCMTKGYGKEKEPHIAYLFTFFVCIAFILIAQLDFIALLVSDLFLITFAFLNYACFHVDLVKPVGWRPTFRYYNKWLSLFTAALCIAVMFLIDWKVALITLAIVVFFYLIVVYRKPEVNWGSSPQAQTYQEALTSIQQLATVDEHVKNFQPQILVLTGLPSARPALVDMANLICKKNSMFVCGNVIKEKQSSKMRTIELQKSYRYLRNNDIRGFVSVIDNMDMPTGVTAMLEVVGVGKIKPNILMIGFKNDWRTCDKAHLEDYFATIHAGFDQLVSVTIVRVPEGLDYSGICGDGEPPETSKSNGTDTSQKLGVVTLNESGEFTPQGTPEPERHLGDSSNGGVGGILNKIKNANKDDVNKSKKDKKKMVLRDLEGNELPKHIVNNITVFQKKQNKGFVDVWWLYDDGGLTLLLPYIISTRSNWASCKLRIFCTSSGQEELEKEQAGIKELLERFRVNFSDLIVITDLNKPPKESTRTWFDGLVRHFIRHEELNEGEKTSLQTKTDRHLRLRELLIDHSTDSNLVVMTLPMPRKGAVSAPMYMAWLETLTANMPPFLLVRGNQTSVLTFYA